jgi:N-acetylmuramoyl-L-alanine amidase
MQEEYLDNSILASKVEDAFENLGKKIRGGGGNKPLWCFIKHICPEYYRNGFISIPLKGIN